MYSIPFSSTFIPPRIAVESRRASASVGVVPAAARVAVRAAATPAETGAGAGAGTAKRQPRGITKPKPVSPALQAVVGVKEIPRTQALKLIWAYIKENNLQDPENKKIIVCDEKLKGIFGGRDRVGFLEISGLLNPHFEK